MNPEKQVKQPEQLLPSDEHLQDLSKAFPQSKRAGNDVVFGETLSLASLDDEKLFRKLKAHTLTLTLGYRDRKIDEAMIAEINTEMTSRGLTKDDYEAFLKNVADDHRDD